MNQKEWKSSNKYDGKYYWRNRARKLLKLREYESLENCDKDATVIHHLRDTEEQRKYNDEHYELFGFEIDEDGNEHFEYGRYVVFWTKEHHDNYHAQSEETRKKNSAGVKSSMTQEVRKKISNSLSGEGNPQYGKRGPMSTCYGRCGEKHPMYGKVSAFSGHHHTDETKKKLSDANKIAVEFHNDQYNKYIEIGGTLKKRAFLKILSEYRKSTYWCQFSFEDFVSVCKHDLELP